MTSVATSNTPRDRLKPQALIKACNVDAQCDGFRPTVHTRRHASCSEQYLMRAHSSEPVSSRSRQSRGLADMHAQSDTASTRAVGHTALSNFLLTPLSSVPSPSPAAAASTKEDEGAGANRARPTAGIIPVCRAHVSLSTLAALLQASRPRPAEPNHQLSTLAHRSVDCGALSATPEV